MIIYNDLTSLHYAFRGIKKWTRTFTAIEKIPYIRFNEAHSIVDSLTYTRNHIEDVSNKCFVGHRRFFVVVQPLTDEITIEVAEKQKLECIESYSDLTDREWFTGKGTELALQPGSFFVTDIDEAIRIDGNPRSELAVYRITVEGTSFHNK